MVEIFREVRRVLRSDGTLWLNLGSSYAADHSQTRSGVERGLHKSIPGADSAREGRPTPPGFKPKDLVPIPWMVAMALQADGWWLRSDTIWAKRNGMPESVNDRPARSHEYVFLLTKAARYFYDAEAVKEPAEWARWGDQTNSKHEGSESAAGWIGSKSKRDLTWEDRKALGEPMRHGISGEKPSYKLNEGRQTRNMRTVWHIATQPYPEAHFATFPEELPRRCILAGTSEKGCCPECGAPWVRESSRGVPAREVDPSEIDRYGTGKAGVHRKIGGQYQKWLDEHPKQTVCWHPTCAHAEIPVPCTVLDIFGGAGTTAKVARDHGRRSILIELSENYAALAAKRLQQLSLLG